MKKPVTLENSGTSVVCTAETIPAALRQQAAERPEVVHLYIRQDEGEVGTLTFAQVLQGAESVARWLQNRGVRPKDTIALMLPTGKEFFLSYLGVLLAGAIPVPVYPPVSAKHIEEYAERQSGILSNAGVRGLITFRQAERLARLLKPQILGLKFVVRAEKLLGAIETGPAEEVSPLEEMKIFPGDIGLIQYTSGSTGNPKGVTLTHANLIANVRAIGEGVGVQPDDVVVCWLPLYHDMGLIGCWLFSLCYGLPLVSLSPLAFLRRPERWLWAMHAYRGTLSPAPNFAFELCVRKVGDDDIEGLDLSSWRVALNGAEPINPKTLDHFQKRYGPYGFRPETMLPVYGLAENTVALSFHPRNQSPRIDHVERETFQREGRAIPVEAEGNGEEENLLFVSVGRAVLAHEIRVLNDDGQTAGERQEGNIEFRGPSATPGYYRNPEATAAIRTEDGWMRTGDLGYIAEGDLFITGRSKDLIIKGGRNIYPQEVETVAAEVEGVRAGCVAAFSVPNPKTGSEGLVVVAETRETEKEIRMQLAGQVRKKVVSVVKVSPDEVRMVSPRTIPKTPSGKLRRAECRRLYMNDQLTSWRAPVWLQLVRLSLTSAWASVGRGLGIKNDSD